ncbi:hypothetical protein QYF36_024896 [Acer negundo]|nr:hypothetical protein QYF36_024896 [Acer negundo]
MSRPRSKTRKEFLGISSISSSPASSLKKDEPWPTTTSKKNQLFICDDGTERNDRRRRQKCHNAMQLAANGFTKTERPSLRPRFRGGHYVAYKAAQKCHEAAPEMPQRHATGSQWFHEDGEAILEAEISRRTLRCLQSCSGDNEATHSNVHCGI